MPRGQRWCALEIGQIHIAPGGRHLLVCKRPNGLIARLDDGPPENFCRPSVDPMLRSVTQACDGRVLMVMLTGMGHDGLAGTQALTAAGGTALAQDEASSVVWGMPGAIARAGLCEAVLPLPALAERAARLLRAPRERVFPGPNPDGGPNRRWKRANDRLRRSLRSHLRPLRLGAGPREDVPVGNPTGPPHGARRNSKTSAHWPAACKWRGAKDCPKHVVEALTTNESLFFRDSSPFQHVRDQALPKLHAARPAGHKLRVWSAGRIDRPRSILPCDDRLRTPPTRRRAGDRNHRHGHRDRPA